MAQTKDPRPQYPPPDEAHQGSYYGQQHSPHGPPPRDERGHYAPPEPPRQGQYAPDPRASAPYPPPGQWPGQQHSAYPPPQPYHDPQHGAYPYPPPRGDMSQPPPQPLQPDAYRLPPPYPPSHAYPYGYPPPPAPAPAPRQRTAIACKYCRKRKIRCSGYDSSPDGRCQNCVRFNQQCLFHPVSSQAAFVPASAVYGPNARGSAAGPNERLGENGAYPRNGEQPPMLYGAHGQPLGPAGPSGQPQYPYPPPQGYPPYPYHPPAQYPPHGQPGHPYEHQGQAPPPQDDRVSLKRPPPDDDPHNENSHTAQSPHPNSKPRHSTYDSRANSSGSYSYTEPSSLAPTSPATSIMSHQSFPPQPYTNGNHTQKGNVSPPAGLTPNSAHSYHSPHNGPLRDDGKTPPPNQPGSAGSSVNGRNGMKVHEMLGNHHNAHSELRGKNDNDMLSKLDGKR